MCLALCFSFSTETNAQEKIYPVIKSGENVITLYNASTSNILNINIEESKWQKFIIWWNQIYNNAIMDYTKLQK